MGADFSQDFRLGAESAALDAKARLAMGSAEAGLGPDHGHFPYARPVRLGWRREANGHGAYDMADEHLWEVFCAECGDADGPAEDQTPAVQELRGPYRGKHHARRVADKHFHVFQGHGGP